MSKQPAISVIISTYNRCNVLAGAIESLLDQKTCGVSYEVIIVDNNSTDQTRQVIESFIARGHENLLYVFEGKQGVSYGRNAGIATARAPIIAFTDDDVRVASDWIMNIKEAFDAHPEIDCVGGKILPIWREAPPAWLTRDHWWPLALLDYGDEPFVVNAGKPLCLPTANVAFRFGVFEKIGLFSPDLQRVKDHIGSMEDQEFLERLWQAERQALYRPDIVVSAEIPAERLMRAYHRKWHKGHGHFYAIMRSKDLESDSDARLFGVPAYLYKKSLTDAAGWVKYWLLRDRGRAFQYENQLFFFAGFFQKRRKDFLAGGRGNLAREFATLLRSLAIRKVPEESRKR